jgi:primosomal protein N' (replication factor Y)
MVAKGHDFPSVTLVGVINADTGLQFPDFRAAERTFQLLTQVAGRAGRGARAGQVVLQTFFPEHYAIRAAAEGDFHGFARKELEFRRAFGYPPFGRLVKLLFQGSSEEDVAREAKHALEVLREASSGVRILGPAPSPIARIQGRHRQQILLKSASSAALRRAVERLEERCPQRKGGVDRIVDVDPQSML